MNEESSLLIPIYIPIKFPLGTTAYCGPPWSPLLLPNSFTSALPSMGVAFDLRWVYDPSCSVVPTLWRCLMLLQETSEIKQILHFLEPKEAWSYDTPLLSGSLKENIASETNNIMFSYHLTIFMLYLVKQHSKSLLYHFCIYLR